MPRIVSFIISFKIYFVIEYIVMYISCRFMLINLGYKIFICIDYLIMLFKQFEANFTDLNLIFIFRYNNFIFSFCFNLMQHIYKTTTHFIICIQKYKKHLYANGIYLISDKITYKINEYKITIYIR